MGRCCKDENRATGRVSRVSGVWGSEALGAQLFEVGVAVHGRCQALLSST